MPSARGDARRHPDTSGAAGNPIAKVRQGGIPPGSDGDVHKTSSVAYGGGKLYVGVGSSCNACTEIDPTRATIQQMDPDGSNMATRATRFRNAIALAINPATGTLWAGGAGQDSLPTGHPYEFFDGVTLHAGVADYGWPECEENRHAYTSGADCSKTVEPRIARATGIAVGRDGSLFFADDANGYVYRVRPTP